MKLSVLLLAGGLALAAAHVGHEHQHDHVDDHAQEGLKATIAAIQRDLGEFAPLADISTFPANVSRCGLGEVTAAEAATSKAALKQHTVRGGGSSRAARSTPTFT